MIYHHDFGNQYQVYSDVFIDKAGIHDGPVVHRWDDVKSCSIAESDPEELKLYFGDDYDERPYAISLTRDDDTTHSITLFGQGWDKVVETGEAINHFSGRDLITREGLEGKPIPKSAIICIIVATGLLVLLALL